MAISLSATRSSAAVRPSLKPTLPTFIRVGPLRASTANMPSRSDFVDFEKDSLDEGAHVREWPMSWGYAALQDLDEYTKTHPTQASSTSSEADTESPDLVGGEWPMAWSLATFEDLGEFYRQKILKAEPGARLSEVMSRDITAVTADIPVDRLDKIFQKANVTGMPVVDLEKHLVGVVSKKDLEKPGVVVQDVMSFPPVACKPGIKVKDAAALMLKYKVHRIPVVDNEAHVIGMVTRTDIFKALEQGK
eukprot:gene4882-5127_t